ncbi:MAG: hypothetical protein IH857_07735 [Deltaproteobacteria bacterium]|nr:hypothetical protein [Deltaproteobacteria bacterium]
MRKPENTPDIIGPNLRAELKELVREVLIEEVRGGDGHGKEDHLMDAEEASNVLAVDRSQDSQNSLPQR